MYSLPKKEILFSPSSLLYLALIAGSVSIFANSATSHNAAVTFIPSLAVSLDWPHFMAISVWVGGLFYISTILLVAIKHRTVESVGGYESPKTKTVLTAFSDHSTFITRKILTTHYYLALLLPRFSLLATVSLGVIGISGIYMAWIQLNNPNAIFSTAYGNILTVKLAAALPLILLGGYHQIKLHKAVVSIASLGRNEPRHGSPDNNLQVAQSFNNNNNNTNNSNDISKLPKKGTKRRENKKLENRKDIFLMFSKTIKIESLIAITVLLVASILTITSPSPMNAGYMNMNMNMTPSSTSMSINNIKNSSFVREVKILGVNTKIEVNPFHSGFNTFKITFTDEGKKVYSKISAVRMIFKNDQADIGPITANLKPISPGVYSITGGYLSQPGEWNIAMAVQRPSDYDLNYRFSSMITQAKESTNTAMSSLSSVLNIQKRIPAFDSFAILAIVLAAIVGFGSAYFYKKSKQELKNTLNILGLDK